MPQLSCVEALEDLRRRIAAARSNGTPVVAVCGGSGCLAYGSDEVAQAFREQISSSGLAGRVQVRVTGCHGFCERGPLVVLHPQGTLYQDVTVYDVEEILSESVLKGAIVERLLYTDPATQQTATTESEVPFYAGQQRLIFGNNGLIDPTSIDDYIAIGGYAAMAKALSEMTPQAVLEEVKRSGLRGRGGGGFPTGRKWETCRNATGERKYVVCNADEGDPGAFMDRSLLEGNPHGVIEGMIIAAYAIGAHDGYVYVRHEYPLAVRHCSIALHQAEEYGLLGESILGSGFHLRLEIVEGAGAFVCGESTALMASIEGRAGEPRTKYIHTSEKGLYDQPTNLNNVETYANVPLIINKGADWYAQIGTEGSKGTKIFSLVGQIANTGLVEVPMGITLREIIYGIGGGIRDGKAFKGVQTGGPSGGCIPEKYLDLPVDFDRLYEVGSMMGSGGMIVMDETSCMVDVAKYFLTFSEFESCGKCIPCREGSAQMLSILARIAAGEGRGGDMALLGELGELMSATSLCGLGQTAANPVLTTLKYFADEYRAHIADKRCPASVCRALIEYSILADKCTGCTACAGRCPQGAITGQDKQPHIIDPDACDKCGICRDVCKSGAVLVQ